MPGVRCKEIETDMLGPMWIVTCVAAALGALALAVTSYRWLFALSYLLIARRRPDKPAAGESRQFTVLVPAHDEEILIGSTVESILAADYPSDCIRLIVIADNCSDDTVQVAQRAGAEVLDRRDPENPGKGRALDWALDRLVPESYDAIVMLDADILLDPDFFRIMNDELASGVRIAQGYYGVSNPDENALTGLMAVTSVMKNLLFNAGKSSIGLSPLLMGTGMVFVRDVIAPRGWKSHSISEDYEEGLSLVAAGERVHFVERAGFTAQEEPDLARGFAQHQRWASGQVAMFKMAARSVIDGLRTANFPLVDAGLEILLPSYSMLMNYTLLGLALCLIPGVGSLAWLLCGGALLLQLAEFALGMWIMGASPRLVSSIAFAPVFLVWKMGIGILAVIGFRRDRWIRTGRRERGPGESGK